eukprot:TRINITY_DN1200_c0_g4_i1.p1 TRINITY_DN1200_c0_g4~~TRINITY_DN1200_c0_g4_i1.p1  ORF type:complete len:1005 (+),score=372.50 TRINITY_DN1200_c0_g4_i1:62-3076(+)
MADGSKRASRPLIPKAALAPAPTPAAAPQPAPQSGGRRRGGYRGEGRVLEDRERGFITCWSGANAGLAARRVQEQQQRRRRRLRVLQSDAGLLRRSVEGRWGRGPLDFPEVPDDESAAGDDRAERVQDIAQRVRRLPSPKRGLVLDLILALEEAGDADAGGHERELNTALEDLCGTPRSSPAALHDPAPSPVPSWLADAKSPPKRASDDAAVFCSSPEVRRSRPVSGRRARTPEPSPGKSDAPEYVSAGTPVPAPVFCESPEKSVHGDGRVRGGDLEASLDSLHQFRLQHLGRLTGEGPETPAEGSRPAASPAASPPVSPAGSATAADEFRIPELPEGRVLRTNVLTTWGDPHYVGLSGIELFDRNGDPIEVPDPGSTVRGSPHSINVLPEYSSDPRVASNLLDGVNRTCDDMHVWLAPFTAGADHTVTVDLRRSYGISMIRFWNYNKSRPHSYRGARHVEVDLDGRFIFRGELAQAPGCLLGAEQCAEVVLFTVEPAVLSRLEWHEAALRERWRVEDAGNSAAEEELRRSALLADRPSTGGGRGQSGRPTTAAHPKSAVAALLASGDHECVSGQTLRLEVVGGWGDMFRCGLQRVEAEAADGDALAVASASCAVRLPSSASHGPPASVLCSGGAGGWWVGADMAARQADEDGAPLVTLTLQLHRRAALARLHLWNYNGSSLRDTLTGVKRVRVFVDGHVVSPPKGFYVRKAPGHSNFEYRQTLELRRSDGAAATLHSSLATLHSSLANTDVRDAVARAQQMEQPFPERLLRALGFTPPLFPVAYVYRFELRSTHGDAHYIGLNGVELRDVHNEPVALSPDNLEATPRDLSIIPECEGDCRTLDKLVDGRNATFSDEHMWLAPHCPGAVNLLYVVFEQPVAISAVVLWNYSKTPARGVREVALYADDALVYSGCLPPAPSAAAGVDDWGQHMIFTNDPAACARAGDALVRPYAQDRPSGSGVLFYDSGRVGDLDQLPQTRCGRTRPTSAVHRQLRPTSGAGFAA